MPIEITTTQKCFPISKNENIFFLFLYWLKMMTSETRKCTFPLSKWWCFFFLFISRISHKMKSKSKSKSKSKKPKFKIPINISVCNIMWLIHLKSLTYVILADYRLDWIEILLWPKRSCWIVLHDDNRWLIYGFSHHQQLFDFIMNIQLTAENHCFFFPMK